MDKAALFGEVLEAAEGLPLEDQENLAEILHRRVVERRREELVREVSEARQEYEDGVCHPVTPDDLLSEILARDVSCCGRLP
jgi:hypothetical protein